MTKLKSKKSIDTARAIIKKLSQHPDKFVQSITYDNGPENAKHLDINAQLRTQSYFCQPYHSWEKGSVEQVNGLMLRFLPKKTDFSTISRKTIQKIEDLLNSRPRKCLDYKTSLECYSELSGALSG